MALPSSGAISLENIRTELSQSGTISMNDTTVRALSGKTTPNSTEIMPTDFYGKSASPTSVPPPSPGGGCVIEGTQLSGLITTITNGVATVLGKSSGGAVWGDNIYGYTSDSDFGKAAVHAGILTVGQTGYVGFTSLGSKPGPFPGTTANGITTSDWGTSWCAILLSAASVSPSSTYSFSSITASVNEGSSGSYSVATTYVSSGTTLYWTINHTSTNSADFTSDSGSFTITGNAGSFIVSMVADSSTEGSQTFTISIRTGSTSGPVVATSSTITIVDTSQSVAATVPGAPTIGVATKTGSTSATVDFTAPASNGGAAITSYTAVSSPEGITGTLSQAGNGTITVNGLTSDTLYTFTVYATNSVGNSLPSVQSNQIRTSAVVTVPDAPTIGVATKTGSTSATVSYTAPANNGGAGVTSHTAQAYISGSPTGITGTLNQGGNGIITVTGLSPSTSYTFRVKATNSVGDSEYSSATSPITTDAAATAPGIPTIGATAPTGQTTATVAFSPPASNGGAAITGYTVISNPGNITATGSNSPITVTGLTAGTSYTFRVKATNSVGDSEYSSASSPAISTFSAATVPGAPTIGVATKTGSTSATVSYLAPASDGGAAITQYIATSTPDSITGTLNQAGDGTITVSGLTADRNYTFTVKAVNSIGQSNASSASNQIRTQVITTVASVMPGFSGAFDNGNWFINSLGGDSPSSADVAFFVRRNGTFGLMINFSVNYVNPTGTTYTTGLGSPYYVIEGDWTSPKSSTIGDSYWVRFSGEQNLKATNAFINGYESSSGDYVNPLLYGPVINDARTPFNSGWLSLSSNKGIYQSNGGDFYGASAKLFNLKIEIASDAAGTTILSTTNVGTFNLGTSSPGGGGD